MNVILYSFHIYPSFFFIFAYFEPLRGLNFIIRYFGELAGCRPVIVSLLVRPTHPSPSLAFSENTDESSIYLYSIECLKLHFKMNRCGL